LSQITDHDPWLERAMPGAGGWPGAGCGCCAMTETVGMMIASPAAASTVRANGVKPMSTSGIRINAAILPFAQGNESLNPSIPVECGGNWTSP
jgi:hypothetical protein